MKKIKMMAFGLVAALLVSGMWRGTVSLAAENTEDQWQSNAEKELSGMKLAVENEFLELYLDETETDIAVRQKSSGEIWFSNPIDIDEDTVSNNYYKRRLKSQIDLTYINESTQISTMNNYEYSITDGQFEVEYLQDGVQITYLMGDSAAFVIIPEQISEERMELFLEKMEDSHRKRVVRNYNQADGFYTLRSGIRDYLREELAGYFEEAGYTEEDYELDMQGAEDDESDDVWFKVPLSYRLDGANLVVTLDPEAIEYNTDGFYLVGVDILRYFGASMGEDGYLFVPDGSGALIRFSNGKVSEASYGAAVYGQDETFVYTSWYQSQIDALNTVKMPVYGIRDGNKALFAVLEEGDAYASINAEIAGKTTGYNDVYPSFTYLQYGKTSLDDIVGANSYYMYSEAKFEGNYTIRYTFLADEKADYSGMAAAYRQYLLDKGVLTDRTQSKALPFFAEYIGAVNKTKTFLGIKYEATEALTTFAQAQEITGRLQEDGIQNLNVVYSGWMNGGLHGTAATGLSVVPKLKKGGINLKELSRWMEGTGGNLYMTLDLQYVYQDKFLDGYSNMRYAPRYFDNTNVKLNEYGLASRVSEGEAASLISSCYVEEIAQKLTGKLGKQEITGINLGTLSWELYSDLLQSNYADRQMAQTQNRKAMDILSGAGQRLLGDNANAYAWGNISEIINVPLFSNHYRVIDEEVPFYGMVLHGYLDYAGEAWNLSDDYETILLKSVESGAGLNFKWIYVPNSVLKETDFDALYSVNYEAWFDRAVESYREMNEQLGYLADQVILSHEILSENVVRVTYEDGSRVYVNYGTQEAAVEDVSVPARGYLVQRGDG